jgi:DNA-binding ferritin-like protein
VDYSNDTLSITRNPFGFINTKKPGVQKRAKEVPKTIVSGEESIRRLLADNDKVVTSITTAYYEAEKAKEIGLCNFLQDRIDQHKKLAWMFKATLAKP